MTHNGSGTKFISEGNRAYITVPAAKAAALEVYLRDKGVRTKPPEVHAGGDAIIEIGGVFEASEVEKLLGAWTG